MVNGKKKGNSFERLVANFLTEKIGVKYMRVPMSGAFSTVNNTLSEVFRGDVFTEDIFFKDLVIECKSYKSIKFSDFFNVKSNFWRWVEQCEREAGALPWFLFFKINRLGCFLVSNKIYSDVKTQFELKLSDCICPDVKVNLVNCYSSYSVFKIKI